ncbi:MAG: cytochrome c [Verrucomicrobiota bacterium]
MKLRYFFLGLAIVILGVLASAGLRGHKFAQPPFELFPDMIYQDKVKDQQPSAFFADGNSARAPIPGTVAMEMPATNDYWATGKWDDTHWGDGIPVHEARDGGRALAVDAANMERGRERFNISCAVCHGAAGDGQGVVTKYGLANVANYHNDRLRQAPDGDLFNTISNGKGQMLGYGYNITIDDRWRIVMYVRALQLSQQAPLADATPEEQDVLDKTRKPAPPAAPATPPPAAPATPAAPAPAPTGTPAPTVPPGGQEPNATKPPGSASLDLSPFIYPGHAVPPRLISDNGMTIVGRTSFTNFVSADRAEAGSLSQLHPARPVKLLNQQTMKGWFDDFTFSQ